MSTYYPLIFLFNLKMKKDWWEIWPEDQTHEVKGKTNFEGHS